MTSPLQHQVALDSKKLSPQLIDVVRMVYKKCQGGLSMRPREKPRWVVACLREATNSAVNTMRSLILR